MVVQWCWLGRGVQHCEVVLCWKAGRRAWRFAHGMGRVQGNLGIKKPGDWGLYPEWRTIDQVLLHCRLLG